MRKAWIAVLSIVALLLVVVLFNLFRPGRPAPRQATRSYSDFIHTVDGGQVKAVILDGSSLIAFDGEGRRSRVFLPTDDTDLLRRLLAKDVGIDVRPPAEAPDGLLHYALNWLPLLGLLTIFGWGMRQMTRTTKALADTTHALLAALAARDRQERR